MNWCINISGYSNDGKLCGFITGKVLSRKERKQPFVDICSTPTIGKGQIIN